MIRGKNVYLRGYERADVEHYHRFVSSADGLSAGYAFPTSADNATDLYDSMFRPKHGKEGYFFVVSPLGSNEFIGTTWLWNLDSRPNGTELSVFVLREHWGTGLGTDAVNATMDFAFGFMPWDRIWLSTDSGNARAQRSFEKSGFQREGIIRSIRGRRFGKRVDSVVMSMIRPDWEALDRPRSWDL